MAESEISPLKVGFSGACPRCGTPSIFKGPLDFVDTCESCGLDISKHDTGDGATFFVITIMGFIVTGLAAYVELAYEPPMWLHAVLWIPVILIGSIGMLRVFRGILLASQYKHLGIGENDE